jgi:hypothetical protein
MTDYQFKVLVVLVSLWGCVLEGTLLSIRVALDQPKVQTIEFEVLPQTLPIGQLADGAGAGAIPRLPDPLRTGSLWSGLYK